MIVENLTRCAHFTYFVAIVAAETGLAYTRVPLVVLSLLTDTLVQTLIVGTHVACT